MKKGILLLLLVCNLTAVNTFAQIRYVKPGGTGNGTSWANASGSIQDMIDYSFSGGQVWVGAGTYALSGTLQMKDGVNVYGGFFVDETSVADRQRSDLDNNGTVEPWEFTHATVLNGQNTVQVVNQATDFSVETVWDGFTITNGKNTIGGGGGAYIRANSMLINAVISNNAVARTTSYGYLATYGGGVYNSGGTIRNCNISNNTTSSIGYGGSGDLYSYGGGVYNGEGGVVTNCLISNNTASSRGGFSYYTYGGGIYNSGTIRNCTISNNTLNYSGSAISSFGVFGCGIYNSNVSALVSNCIITNNTFGENSSPISYGGGIYQGTIDSCTVTNNRAHKGGGIYCSENISNCIVKGNTSTSDGGGIYSSGNNITIANCIVSENVASISSASIYGGGIYCAGSNATIANCIINGNTVSNPTASASYSAYGGGVAFANTTAKITDCIIKDNITLKNGLQGGYGGGIYQGTITRCRMENNASGEGGGFYGSNADNCLLLNNSATTNGGGGFLAANGRSVNCTFVGNTSGRGGGIYFSTNTGTSATNCIFWQNYAPMWEQVGTPSASNAADVTYSAIQEQYPGTGNIIIAEDNENGGPHFFNNYHLQENSPCINTGNNAILTLADTIDLAGNRRIFDTIVDMGAYERQGINPPAYTISGQVTYNGNPLAGVMMIHEGDSSLLTNASGEYSITMYQGANITLTPTKEGYGFLPSSVTFSNVSDNIEQDFTSVMIISVTNITNIPDTIFSRVPYTLSGIVAPSNATNQTIIWSVVSAGTTGATITGNTLNTTAEGTLTVMATIIDGITLGVNYVQNFSIVSSLNYYSNGYGTLSSPYQICTPRQLRAFAIYINTGDGNVSSGKYYKLMNDIDLSSYDNWEPIGNNNSHCFLGNFDGNEKVVRNLTVNNSSNYQGLFGYATNATIQNLGIENCTINGNQYVGGLFGYSYNSTISNCNTTGNVSGSSNYVGGLVGYASSSYISNCYSTANVFGDQSVGGLVGFNSYYISNSYASGKVKASRDYVGGLVGQNSSGTIRNCVAANDSVITESNVSNISRVCGNNSGLYYNNYALNVMIIIEGDNSYYVNNSSNSSGTGKSPVMLKSLSFYTTTSNWYSTATSWSIGTPSGIWNICNETSFPFFHWQNIACDSIIEIFCGGSGTLADPYEICTSQQFKDFADYINAGNGETTVNKYYKLMTDIDLIGYENWTPIGSSVSPFQGNFDGNEKVVRNLTINDSSDYQGLFGYTINDTIKNLGIENCNVNGAEYVGGLLGYGSATTISNCYLIGNVSGTGDYVGGLVGYATYYSSITNCYATANVGGNESVGGLVGFNCYSSIIKYSYASGKVKASGDYVGGLVGQNSSSTIKNCVAANDSVISTANVRNISRVCGNNSGIYYNNYALNVMIIKEGGNSYYFTGPSNTAGTSKSPVTLKSLSFYATTSNWYSYVTSWSIADSSGIWNICNETSFPFLRWQNIACDSIINIFCGGSGTLAAPYEICNLQQFEDFADYINAGNGENTANKYYKLMTDLDFIGYGNWIPIGNSISRFHGKFNGNAKVLRNLTINDSINYQGLFGCIEGAKIQNLGIENCNVSGASYVGALVGHVSSTSLILSCYATGYVKGTGNDVGGLVGDNGTLINCFAAVDVEGGNDVGGLVGSTMDGYINNCYATGTVKGTDNVGGLVGDYYQTDGCYISNSIAANDSIIATTNTTNVNRIFGYTNYENRSYMYALNTMVVQSNNTTITVTNNTVVSGLAQFLATLTNLSFYTTSSNWEINDPWSIADPSGIWQICNGEGLPFLRWQGITCGSFVPVTNITGVSTTATATIPLTLTGTVLPSNATNQTITWSVQNAGTTGATITGNTLNTTAAGTVTVRATIPNGTAVGTNYTKNFTITVSNPLLSGTVSISGSAVFGETLTAVTSGLTSTPIVSLGTLSYQWKRNSTNIGTNSATYTLVEADINQTITVTVSAANCTGNVTSAATAVVTKAPQSAPALPTLSSSTATTITLDEVSDCEYNINGGSWQSLPIFEGLTPNTSYTFSQRRKETVTHLASPASASAQFTTDNTTLPLYTIVASANDTTFGTLTPYGETQVEEGSDITFYITPNSNYVIDSVLVNGAFQGAIATYTFTNVQSDGSIAVVFKREVGIAENALSGISVYPNPTRDELRITSDKMQITGIEFFDLIGKKVFTPLVSQLSPEIVINISHLKAGVYFVRISTEAGIVIKKVLKE